MSLQQSLPWTKSPLIINAPMGGIAVAELAIAVTKAGGLGQIGAVNDLKDLEVQLQKVDAALSRHNGLLPIGLGLLTFAMDLEATLPFVEKYKPAVVWLFAEHDFNDYAVWAERLRKVSSESQIWIQHGSVEGAVEIARRARPDVLSMQGSDAGGHGWDKGAGVISLIPETLDALEKAGIGNIALVAAGGISDGRAAAAALTLGAQGVVMGTRFLAAHETRVHPEYQAAVIAAQDGGQSTVRAKVFDELKGPNQWPKVYDGRSIHTASYDDLKQGVHIDDIRKRHAEAAKTKDAGFSSQPTQARAAEWAGTGVGLVRKVQSAAEIVEEVRGECLRALNDVRSRI